MAQVQSEAMGACTRAVAMEMEKTRGVGAKFRNHVYEVESWQDLRNEEEELHLE